MFAIICLVLPYSVGGWSSQKRTVTSDHREICLQKSYERRACVMLTTDLFISILSLCITCFALGYAIGSSSNNKTQK